MASATDAPPRRRGTRHAPAEVRRAQILEAALRCIAERGYDATTMDDVARACALSKGSVYRFFRSKEELLWALFDAFDRRAAESVETVEPDADPIEAIGRSLGLVLDALGGHAELLAAWFELFGRRGLRERFAGVYLGARASLARRLEHGVAEGRIRPVAADEVAAGLVGVVEGMLLQTMVDPSYDARGAWPSVWEVWRRGLEP